MLDGLDDTTQATKVLLVEANRYDEELTLRALRNHHLAGTVQVARDGAEALECLLDRPELILLDLRLPKVDGLTVLQCIRGHTRTRDIPVFLLLSSRHDREIVDSRRLGATGCIVKPVDFDNFAQAMRSIGRC